MRKGQATLDIHLERQSNRAPAAVWKINAIACVNWPVHTLREMHRNKQASLVRLLYTVNAYTVQKDSPQARHHTIFAIICTWCSSAHLPIITHAALVRSRQSMQLMRSTPWRAETASHACLRGRTQYTAFHYPTHIHNTALHYPAHRHNTVVHYPPHRHNIAIYYPAHKHNTVVHFSVHRHNALQFKATMGS